MISSSFYLFFCVIFLLIFYKEGRDDRKGNVRLRETERSFCPDVPYSVSEGFRRAFETLRDVQNRSRRGKSKRDNFFMDG